MTLLGSTVKTHGMLGFSHISVHLDDPGLKISILTLRYWVLPLQSRYLRVLGLSKGTHNFKEVCYPVVNMYINLNKCKY